MVVRKRASLEGPAAVFVTTTLRKWVPLFHHDTCAKIMIDCLNRSLELGRLSCIAYVLMPSHLHLVLGMQDYQSLPGFMQGLKSISSRLLWPIVPEELREVLHMERYRSLWKPRYDDFVITSEAQFRIKMDYIHNNPVKANLSTDPTEFQYSSAGDWMGDRKGLVPIDKAWHWIE